MQCKLHVSSDVWLLPENVDIGMSLLLLLARILCVFWALWTVAILRKSIYPHEASGTEEE